MTSSGSTINDNKSKHELMYGEKALPLPFFQKTPLPSPLPEVPFLPTIVPEACGSKILLGAVTGYVMGLGLGVFMGAMGDVSPIQIAHGKEVPQSPLREQMRAGYRALKLKSVGMGKTFFVLTALFGGVECVIEKYRGKHDTWNSVLSGCAVGATLSAKAGPAAACAGCAGFAGFSFAVDRIMGH